jgi:hydroxyacylglutathione hydrolase
MMIFRQLLNERVAAASYLIGCVGSGEAVVVDPSLPAAQYALLAADKGLRITTVVETHLHADYFSSGRALAALTGATIRLPRAAEADYEHRPLDDGETLLVGKVALTALHTPGHTPEHTVYLVADTARSARPWFVLTGDCLFVGDVGRADLVDLPGSGPDLLYDSIFGRLLSLTDDVEIFPGHYGGSACGGKDMSGKPSSTIGFERCNNWALRAPDKATFSAWISALPRAAVEGVLLHRHTNQGRLPLPEGYFDAEPPPAAKAPAVPQIALSAAISQVAQGHVMIDLRPRAAFAASHPCGALNTAYSSSALRGRVAAALPPGEPLLVLGDNVAVASAAAADLAEAGRNPVAGYLATTAAQWAAAGGALACLPQIDIPSLHQRAAAGDLVLDVREPFEWAKGTLEGAAQISLGDLRERLGELPRSRAIVVVCESGTRASLAASLLRRHGISDVAIVVPEG